ncbi:MCE family protein [Nocardia stercoris]|uniref:MCE family protein n=1 Tax=Nocardia stercoris TaxID=2483361 RepID=A0A3M2LBW8_9NOCA|nr:MCE family protein [Nocardia stercoris]RMI34063.1 MCE family protein [Nocardia stercoris]
MRKSVRATLAKVALVSACALTLGSCSLPGPLNNDHHYTADFRNIAGMFEGNPITVLGVEVGHVDKIIPKGQYVEVHMTVDGDIKLPKNVVAALISPSIVTDRHIELSPVYTGGATLADKSHLTVEQTRTPVELDTMIKTIDQFAAALKPDPGQQQGPLSGTLLYSMVNGQGDKIRDTLNALSGALKLGVDNKDALSTIIVKLNELTSMLADNDASVRGFSQQVTQMTGLLAEQAPGLQATLDQLNAFLVNTSTALGDKSSTLASALAGLTNVTNQLRQNAAGVTEVADVAPLLMQNVNSSMDRNRNLVRLHTLLLEGVTADQMSLFCERIQMRSDACRTGKPEDLGPDMGISAALLGITQK